MRDACIRATSAALGRPLTAVEERGIEQRIQSAQLRAAREDPAAWRALSPSDRMVEAGRRAAEELVVETAKKTQRIEQTVLAHDRISTYRDSQVANGDDADGVAALERTLVAKYDMGSNGFQSVETRANATFDFSVGQIADVFETANPGLWQRIQRDIWRIEPLRKAFVDALHDPNAKVPPEIRRAADLYHETANALREQFNAAGGVVGRLENWGAPHNWSARLAQKIGRDAFVTDMLASVDRSAYVHEDGRAYTPDELRGFFEEAWATIVSDGMTKDSAPAPFPGGAVKANRGSQHRVIHLRPDMAYPMLRKYSEQNILEAMLGGLRRMSRDVALVETYGPNSDYQFKLQLEAAMTDAAKADPTRARALTAQGRKLQYLYDSLAGNTPPPANRTFADVMGTARNVQIASKLGGAVITSISDYATLYQTALLNRLNPLKVALNSSLAWSSKSQRYARRMGLMMDAVLGEAQRYTTENLTSKDVSSRVASAVVRASGLNFVTDARRLGFSMTMMDSVGHLTRRYADVTKLKADDYRILADKGIDQQTWDIWRAASLDNWGANHTLLTPDAIMAAPGFSMEAKRDAAIRLLGIVREEQDLAIITPGARERAAMTFGTQAGTIGGEFARSMLLFKAFPWTFMTRHWERMQGYDSLHGRVAYFAALYLFMSLGGAAANWIKDILSGRDPRTMNLASSDPRERSVAVRNMLQATISGGGLGIYGDFLFSETQQFSQSGLAETMLGPNVSTASDALSLTFGNATQAAAGEDTNFAQEAGQFARSITPGANLWYTRAITDRAIFNQLQDMLDPGATDRMQQRQYSTRRTEYFWDPSSNPIEGEGPERAPELPN